MPNYQTAADAFDRWRDSVLTGEAPVLYPVGEGELARIEVGPGLVNMFAAPPVGGKTALVLQLTVDALRLNPSLRAVVCNVEMPPSVLLDRQLARLSGISLQSIRHRQLDASQARPLEIGLNTLETVVDRLSFVRPPFDLQNVAETVDEFGGQLLVLDYIQRIPPPGRHNDRRGSIDATMDYLRRFADAGLAVIVVSAVARQRDAQGRSTYHSDALSLASFRESSELEYGADNAYILASQENTPSAVCLRHLKARYSEPRDIRLRFDRSRQSFTSEVPTPGESANGQLPVSLAALWNCTEAAGENAEADGGGE